MPAAGERHMLAGGQMDTLGRAQFDAGRAGQHQMWLGQFREIAAGGALLSDAILSASITWPRERYMRRWTEICP